MRTSVCSLDVIFFHSKVYVSRFLFNLLFNPLLLVNKLNNLTVVSQNALLFLKFTTSLDLRIVA